MSPILRKNTPSVFIAEINLAQNPHIKETFFIKQFPYFRLYVDMTRFIDYKPSLDPKEAIKWVKRKVNLPSKEIKTDTELDKLFENNNKAIVIYTGDLQNDNYIVFQEVAKMMINDHDILFRHINIENLNKNMLQKLKIQTIKDKYLIKVYNPNGQNIEFKHFGKEKEQSESKSKIVESDDIYYQLGNTTNINHVQFKNFISTVAFKDLKGEKLVNINKHVFSKILVYHKPVMVLYNGKNNWDQYLDIVELFLPQVDIFVYKGNFSNTLDQEIASILKIKLEDEPQLWIMDFTSVETEAKKYKLTRFDFQKLKAFYDGFKVGKLKPFVITQDIEPNQYKNGVLLLNSESFDSAVSNTENEIMVFFTTDN